MLIFHFEKDYFYLCWEDTNGLEGCGEYDFLSNKNKERKKERRRSKRKRKTLPFSSIPEIMFSYVIFISFIIDMEG